MMLNAKPALSHNFAQAVERLASLALLTTDDLAVLHDACKREQSVAPRRDLIAAGSTPPASLLILDGWAFRSCLLADGRRQILNILLPGDVIQRRPTGVKQSHSVTALTALRYCSIPEPDGLVGAEGLRQALAVSQASDIDHLYRQIARLGRLSALERVADWLLEMRDRLDMAGQCHGHSFPLPVTQETIADVLGLTSVHVNRTLMTLRRDDLIRVGGGRGVIIDRKRCELLVRNR